MNPMFSAVNNWNSSSFSGDVPRREVSPRIDIAEQAFRMIESANLVDIAHMIETSPHCLEMVDEATGDTLLHRAIRLGKDDTASMLVAAASQHAPGVLNYKNHRTQTPLMAASKSPNVVLMQQIIAAGGSVGESRSVGHAHLENQDSGAGKAYTHAVLLSEAKGDLDAALALAYRHERAASCKLFLDAGACIEKVFAQAGRQVIDWLLSKGALDAHQLPKMLEQVIKSENKELVTTLSDWDVVLYTLDNVIDQSTESIANVLRNLLDAGIDGQTLLSKIVQRYVEGSYRNHRVDEYGFKSSVLAEQRQDVKTIQSLIAVGISASDELIKHASRPTGGGRSNIVSDLVKAGADYHAVFALEGADYRRARSNLLEPVLKYLIKHSAMAPAEKISEFRALIRAEGEPAVSSIANYLLANSLAKKHSSEVKQVLIDSADSLFRAGVLPDRPLLLDASDYVRNAPGSARSVSDRIAESASQQALAFALLQRAVRVDTSHVINLIRQEEEVVASYAKTYSFNGRPNRTSERLRFIIEVAIRDSLSRLDLSSQEKVTALAQWLSSHTASEFAADLLKDAVYSRNMATVKLLLIAGVNPTKSFVSLAHQLDEAQVWYREPRVALLVKYGADYQPAFAALTARVDAYLNRGDLRSAKAEQVAFNRLEATIEKVVGVGLASQ